MVEHTTVANDVGRKLADVVDRISSALAAALTALKWGALLGFGGLWLAFWVMLAGHHLSMGNTTAVAVATIPILAPPAIVLVGLRGR